MVYFYSILTQVPILEMDIILVTNINEIHTFITSSVVCIALVVYYILDNLPTSIPSSL